MKSFFERIVLICAAMSMLNIVVAQENQSRFLQEAKNALRVGDCQRASDNYDMAKKLDGISDADVEKAIALCIKNSEADTSVIQSVSQKYSVFTCDYLDYYFYMDNLAMTYDRAELAAKGSKYANHSDWRIPTIEELQLIIDYHCGINSNFPQNIGKKRYWSSTSDGSSSKYYYGYNNGKSSCIITDLDNKKYCVYVRKNKNGSSDLSSKGKKKK